MQGKIGGMGGGISSPGSAGGGLGAAAGGFLLGSRSGSSISSSVSNSYYSSSSPISPGPGAGVSLPKTFPSTGIDSGWIGAGVIGASRGWLGSGSMGGSFSTGPGSNPPWNISGASKQQQMEFFKKFMGGPGSGLGGGPGSNPWNTMSGISDTLKFDNSMKLYSGIPVDRMMNAASSAASYVGGAAMGAYNRGRAWDESNAPGNLKFSKAGAKDIGRAFAKGGVLLGAGLMSVTNTMNQVGALNAASSMVSDANMQAEYLDRAEETLRATMGGATGMMDDVRTGQNGTAVIMRRRIEREINTRTTRRGIDIANIQDQSNRVGLRGLSGQLADINNSFDSANRNLMAESPLNSSIVDANNQLRNRQLGFATSEFNRDQLSQVMSVNTQIKQNDLFRKGAFQESTELGINDQYRVRIENARLNEQNSLADALAKLRDSEIERSRFISPRNISQIDYLRTSTTGTNYEISNKADAPRASQIDTLIEIMRHGFITLTTMSGTGTISVPVAQ